MATRIPLAISFLASFLTSCVYVPVVDEYDASSASCGTFTKSMSLDVIRVQGNVSARCENEGCEALLASAAVVTAGSAIISGSIVLTGNTIHWLEYQGKCSDSYLNITKQKFLDSFGKGKAPS